MPVLVVTPTVVRYTLVSLKVGIGNLRSTYPIEKSEVTSVYEHSLPSEINRVGWWERKAAGVRCAPPGSLCEELAFCINGDPT